MKTLFILFCSLIVLFIPTAHAANPPDATYHGITETEIDEYKYIEVGVGDTLYGSVQSTVRRSVDHGATWATWRSFTSDVASVWIASDGIVYLTFSNCDTLKRCTANGTCTDVLTFHSGIAYSWHMAENDSLYCATYTRGVPVADTTGAYLYRSTAGNVWSLINHPHSRHYHFVAAHPWNDTLYTSRGDIGAARSLEKSGNNGGTYAAIKSDEHLAMPVSFAFTPTRLIFGSDCGTGVNAGNKFYYQNNTNGSWVIGDSLSGTQDNYPWSMALDNERVVFAGTIGKTAADNDVRMYASYDSGGTWLSVKDFHDEVEWEGLLWISQGTDASGYKYYTVDDEDGAGVQTFRFANIPVWTVSPRGGSGGDFASIAAALADWRVGPADTLILLAGSHDASNEYLYNDMTVRGYSQDYDDVIVWNTDAAHCCFIADSTATFRNFTFRTDLALWSNMHTVDADYTTADVTCDNVRWAGCVGAYEPGVYSAANNPVAIRLRNCVTDSCHATSAARGIHRLQDVGVGIVRNCTFDSSVATRPSVYMTHTAGVVNKDTLYIGYSLFTDNRSTGNLGGAVALTVNSATAYSRIEYSTFDNNECATAADGQIYGAGNGVDNELYHCIITGADSTNAIRDALNEFAVIEHCNAWGNADNCFAKGLNGTATDTLHLDPGYTVDYAAKAKECRDCADGSYMGWLEYIPSAPPVPPTVNPALYQKDFYQDIYAVSDTVCCHGSHWDIIVPDLTYAGSWEIYPYGGKSKQADGINVKVTLAKADNGWSDTFFIPLNYGMDIQWDLKQLFETAVDSVAVQGVFSTCAAGSTLQYQFIMEGW